MNDKQNELDNEQEILIIDQFKESVNNDDVEAVERLFKDHPSLLVRINEPLFSFDTPAIVVAASRGSREMVDLLLAQGADINARSSWWAGGFGVLHHDHHELARYLIGQGADVDIHAAAGLGMLETVKERVQADPSVVNERGPDGQVPLHFATTIEIVDYLLDHGADIDIRDMDHGSTPAQYAVDNPDKCRHLIARGAEVDIFMACKLGDIDLVRGVLESDPGCLQARVGKGKFTSGDSDGGHIYLYKIGVTARPLHLAASLHHHEAIELLLQYSSSEERLLLAYMQADKATVQLLISEHPDIVHSLQLDDQALIVDAAWDNQVEAVRIMLEAGFDVDAVHSDNPNTALNGAAVRGYHDIVQLLLAHGASVHTMNIFGGTPLSASIWGSLHFRDPLGDYPAVVTSLIRAGAKLPDQASGSPAVVEVLIQHGVSTSMKN